MTSPRGSINFPPFPRRRRRLRREERKEEGGEKELLLTTGAGLFFPFEGENCAFFFFFCTRIIPLLYVQRPPSLPRLFLKEGTRRA